MSFCLLASVFLLLLGAIYSVEAKREEMSNDIGYGIIFSGVILLGLSVFVMFLQFVSR